MNPPPSQPATLPSPLRQQQLNFELAAKVHTLDNGLKILVYEDHAMPIVALSFAYQVGSRNEVSGATGLAHFFEHMMFNGSKNFRPGEFDRLMEAYGASNNAYTTKDVTVYQDWTPPSALGLVFELEADRMGQLSLDPIMIESERGVVANERRRYMAEPDSVLDELLYATAYTAHPYRWPVLGWMADIESWQTDDLRRFYEQYYSPHNCKLIITGDVHADEVFQMAEASFGKLPRRTAGRPVHTVEPPQRGLRRAEVRMPSGLTQVQMAWHIPSSRHEDYWALSTLEKILFQGQSSICYEQFVKSELALNVGGGIDSQSVDPTLFALRTNLRQNTTPRQFEDKFWQIAEQLQNQPIPEEDLRKASQQLRCDLLRSLKTVSGQCDLIAAFELFGEGIEEIPLAMEKYAQVTAEDVQRVATKYLQPSNCTIVELNPTSVADIEELKSGEAEVIRAECVRQSRELLSSELHPATGAHKRQGSNLKWCPDANSEETKISLPAFTTVILPTGLTIKLLERRQLPLTCMALAFDCGGRDAQVGEEGIASVVARLLRKGTKNYSEQQIAKVVDQAAGYLGVSVGKFALTVFTEFMSADSDLGLELLHELVCHPLFEQDKFEQVKRRTIDAVKNDRSVARGIVDRFFVGAVLNDHPWSQPTSGDEATLGQLTRESVQKFHQRFFTPERACMVVVGDFDTESMTAAISQRFADWTEIKHQMDSAGDNAAAAAEIPKIDKSRVLVVDKPNSDEVVFQIGRPGISRTDPDYAEFTLMNILLGGRFTSRLNTVLRIEEGLTYGIGSGTIDFKHFGLFRIDSFSANETIERALDLTLEVTRNFVANGISEAELESAKAYFRGQHPTDFETSEQLAEWLLFLHSRGLNPEHLSQSMAKIEGLTLERANEIIASHFKFDELQFVLVGDATVLDFASKYGQLEVISSETAKFVPPYDSVS